MWQSPGSVVSGFQVFHPILSWWNIPTCRLGQEPFLAYLSWLLLPLRCGRPLSLQVAKRIREKMGVTGLGFQGILVCLWWGLASTGWFCSPDRIWGARLFAAS